VTRFSTGIPVSCDREYPNMRANLGLGSSSFPAWQVAMPSKADSNRPRCRASLSESSVRRSLFFIPMRSFTAPIVCRLALAFAGHLVQYPPGHVGAQDRFPPVDGADGLDNFKGLAFPFDQVPVGALSESF